MKSYHCPYKVLAPFQVVGLEISEVPTKLTITNRIQCKLYFFIGNLSSIYYWSHFSIITLISFNMRPNFHDLCWISWLNCFSNHVFYQNPRGSLRCHKKRDHFFRRVWLPRETLNKNTLFSTRETLGSPYQTPCEEVFRAPTHT